MGPLGILASGLRDQLEPLATPPRFTCSACRPSFFERPSFLFASVSNCTLETAELRFYRGSLAHPPAGASFLCNGRSTRRPRLRFTPGFIRR